MKPLQAGEFPKLKLRQFAQIQERETPESKYWKKFALTGEEHLQGAPVCIHFNPASNNQYIVSASTKVSLYNSLDDKVQRSFSRFNDDVYSGRYRKDGKLIVAGDKSGYVKVFDVKTKAALRQIKAHSSAVRATTWSCDGLNMLSGSDDKHVKRWDLGTQECVWNSKMVHTDYVRTIDASPTMSDIFVSGSYDHTIKLWDSRQEKCILDLDHGQPVEVCKIAPSGAMLMTAGGNEIKIWDMLNRGRLIHTFSNHQKNITGIAFDSSMSRMLSCGLDGHVKIYSLETLEVVHGIKYGSPLMSVALSPDNKKLVVGYTDGRVVFRNKREDTPDEDAEQTKTTVRKGSNHVTERFYKGAGTTVERSEDAVVETERAARLRPYEQHLLKFNYQMALDAALKTRNPLVVVTVLEELGRRNGLTIALTGRDEVTLEPLLAFCARYISNPRYAMLIVQVMERILDLYSTVLGQSDAIDELFLKLRKQVKLEYSFHKEIIKVLGSLDGVINSSILGSH